jgi:hypothetical protein
MLQKSYAGKTVKYTVHGKIRVCKRSDIHTFLTFILSDRQVTGDKLSEENAVVQSCSTVLMAV